MKKAIVISAYDYYEVRAKHIIRHLIDDGYSVTYYIQSFDHYKKEQRKDCRQEATMIKTISYSRNVSVRRLCSCFIFSRRVYKRIMKEKPDLVYGMIPPNSLSRFLSKGKKKQGYKLIFDMIDSWPESFAIENRLVKLVLAPMLSFWKWLRNIGIIRADLILAVSETCFSVLPTCPSKKKVFYPMPQSEGVLIQDCVIDEEKISFCYLGGINRLVNICHIVEILNEVKKYKKVEVHIIGNGEKKQEFVDKLAENGVGVIDHGELYDWEEKVNVFSKCNFGLNVPNKEARVTMSLKGTEYLCASLPLLNEAGGVTEKFIDKYCAGINTKELSIQDIAKKLSSLSSNEMIKMRKNANLLYKTEFEKKNNKELLHW